MRCSAAKYALYGARELTEVYQRGMLHWEKEPTVATIAEAMVAAFERSRSRSFGETVVAQLCGHGRGTSNDK